MGEEEDRKLDLSLFDDEEVEEAEEQMARAKVTTTEEEGGECDEGGNTHIGIEQTLTT